MKNSKTITWENALETCMPLIQKLASQMARVPNSVIDRDDLINCGLIGLMEATKSYNDSKDVKFSTFAYFRIKGSMLDEVRKYQTHKRNVIEKHRKIQNAKRELLHSKGSVKNKTLSETCGLPKKEIEKINKIVSLKIVDADISNQASEDETPENVIQLKQRNENLQRAVSKLPPNEQNVINFRFHRELRLKEIGQRLQLSEARVHQLEKSALFKLKDIYKDDDFDKAA
tara:strand:+ start:3540 stop:4226 length:687 start_codon:yes stop_codon:yes gene_type:complete